MVAPSHLTLSSTPLLCRHTYKDWISADIQQILIETHDLPLASEAKQTGHGVFPKIPASEYFDAFEANGFVLYSKEVNRFVFSRSWHLLSTFLCYSHLCLLALAIQCLG
jgi:hypothetical protein